MTKIHTPLAEIQRPKNVKMFVGQRHLLGENHPLGQALFSGKLHSMIFWGPSGSGKTTLARLIAERADADFVTISATSTTAANLKSIIENAKKMRLAARPSALFIDEIHHFNKHQQDIFLPHIESGLITLIGTTTENPSFSLNQALISRVSVYIFKPLTSAELLTILKRTLEALGLTLDESSQKQISVAAGGDARRLLNIVEQLKNSNIKNFDEATVRKFLAQNLGHFDRGGDIFYQQLSAFHKSVRGSSPDAALYWMARMLLGGCPARVIARRLLAVASEDIGNADPRALQIVLNGWDIYERVGKKEGERAIAQAAIYCAVAPKSNAVYTAFQAASQAARESPDAPVPKHLCNAPTKLMKNAGFGAGYRYPHDEENAYAAGQNYFPETLGEPIFYHPSERGLERKIAQKLAMLRGEKS